MRYLLSTLFILVTTFFSATSVVLADSTQSPIIIGAIYNTTGNQAALDMPSAQGAQLAVREINKSGGILGRPVKLELVNGNSQPATIQKQAKHFAQNPAISVVLGLSDTNMVLAAAPALAQARKLFITSGATSPNLPTQIPNYLFLACYTDHMQATAMAEYAVDKLHSKKAFVLADENMSYTILLSQYFQQAYKKLGGQLVGIHTFKSGNSLARQINFIKSAKTTPDVIFLAAGPSEAATLIKEIRQAGLHQPILGGDSFDSNIFIKSLGKQANNIYFSTHAFINLNNSNNKVQEFISKYRAYYHQLPTNSFAALGYDTVKLVAAAITKAQSTDPAKIRQALYAMKDWSGITGDISYNNVPIPEKPVVIVKIHNGQQILASK